MSKTQRELSFCFSMANMFMRHVIMLRYTLLQCYIAFLISSTIETGVQQHSHYIIVQQTLTFVRIISVHQDGRCHKMTIRPMRMLTATVQQQAVSAHGTFKRRIEKAIKLSFCCGV